MTSAMVVRLPVTGTFGTDEEFDLRAALEHDLHAALTAGGVGDCGLGETDAGFACIALEDVSDPDVALDLALDVLARHGQLHRATIFLQTAGDDPDEIDRHVLWPRHLAGVA
ncbi:MAG: hypothetical protein K2V38_13520 [Gemmataceae bacterium]|nr:hypothetical protein [Gemmataceae bacterium]